MASTQDELDELRAQAERNLLKRIAEGSHGPTVKNYAEAYAWLVAPNNSHGGTTEIKGS